MDIVQERFAGGSSKKLIEVLTYNLKYPRELVETLKKRAKDNREELPDELVNSPQLIQGLELFYLGFTDLSTCRFGKGMPISWYMIDAYCVRNNIIGEQREDFFHLISEMDISYLSKSGNA